MLRAPQMGFGQAKAKKREGDEGRGRVRLGLQRLAESRETSVTGYCDGNATEKQAGDEDSTVGDGVGRQRREKERRQGG